MIITKKKNMKNEIHTYIRNRLTWIIAKHTYSSKIETAKEGKKKRVWWWQKRSIDEGRIKDGWMMTDTESMAWQWTRNTTLSYTYNSMNHRCRVWTQNCALHQTTHSKVTVDKSASKWYVTPATEIFASETFHTKIPQTFLI